MGFGNWGNGIGLVGKLGFGRWKLGLGKWGLKNWCFNICFLVNCFVKFEVIMEVENMRVMRIEEVRKILDEVIVFEIIKKKFLKC